MFVLYNFKATLSKVNFRNDKIPGLMLQIKLLIQFDVMSTVSNKKISRRAIIEKKIWERDEKYYREKKESLIRGLFLRQALLHKKISNYGMRLSYHKRSSSLDVRNLFHTHRSSKFHVNTSVNLAKLLTYNMARMYCTVSLKWFTSSSMRTRLA